MTPIQLLNRKKLALHIFPSSYNEEQALSKLSDNRVILSSVPSAPIFPFSHVIDLNSRDQSLFDTVPHTVLKELAQGKKKIVVQGKSMESRFNFLFI